MVNKKGANSKDYVKWLKIAAWAPIVSIVISIVLSIIFQIIVFSGNSGSTEEIPLGLNLTQSIISLVLGALFLLGFYQIGKKYNSNLLKVAVVLMIILSLIVIIVQYTYFNSASEDIKINFNEKFQAFNSTIQSSGESPDQFFTSLFQDAQFVNSLSTLLGAILIYLLVAGLLNILIGSALIKIGDNVRLAKSTGILLIVGVATSIILIGFLVLFVAWIMQIIILFKEAYKK
jgi:hypothetical protein